MNRKVVGEAGGLSVLEGASPPHHRSAGLFSEAPWVICPGSCAGKLVRSRVGPDGLCFLLEGKPSCVSQRRVRLLLTSHFLFASIILCNIIA